MRVLRVCTSDTGKLPEILAGCSIEIKSQRGDYRTATVFGVIEHRKDFVQVRKKKRHIPTTDP